MSATAATASINVLNRYRYTKANVSSAITAIRKSTEKALAQAPSFLRKYPGSFRAAKGKLTAVAADGTELVVIPTEDRDDFLREVVYGKTSEYPFGRDSLFAILKDEVMNVSKRDIEGFLNAQGPLVHRRARPPKQKREHLRQIRNVGQLSIDLAHIKAKDFESVLGEKGHDYMGVPGKRGYQQDRYFLNAVDLLTGYLITEIVQGKTAKEVAPKLSKLLDRYEKQLGQKVKKVEVDKGGEFRGVTRKMLDDRGIRTIEKITNAAVEQTNAKMQRIFWALVEQRRGGFLATAKQAVKISNRTYNRRIRMSPEDALEKIVAGEKITKKTPKAGPTEKKRAWKVGEKVRALKKPRAKGDDLGYKAYKGDHYGAVTPISKVRYSGVYPKYLVGARWRWGDEIIRARPADTKAHNLVIKRPIILPKAMRPRSPSSPAPVRKLTARQKALAKKRAKKPAAKPAAPGGFRKDQDVWYTTEGKRVGAKVKKVDAGDKTADLYYYWPDDKKFYTEVDVPWSKLKAQPTYEIGDKVQVLDEEAWWDGEVDKHAKDGNYRVFWKQDGRRWAKTVSGTYIRARP